jgi:glycosyltransferase involved in cell wall biosynthesis
MGAMSLSISVIVPNYNHAPYLRERLDSVLAQTYTNFEVIILDDCSTDNSIEVIESYRGHPHVSQIVINAENSGTTFKQWAKGIALAQYEWIWIAESDDWCEPTLLETLIAGITPTTCISYCQSIAIKDNDILWTNACPYLSKTYDGPKFVKEKMLSISQISNASQAIFRKEIYKKIDKSFTTYRYSGDYLFWMLVAQHGEIYVSGKYLNYFRKHDKDVTGPSLINGQGYREYLRILRTLQEQHVLSEEEREYLLIRRLNELLWDKRVAPSFVNEISVLYHQELGRTLLSSRAYQLLGNRSFLKVLLHKLRPTR